MISSWSRQRIDLKDLSSGEEGPFEVVRWPLYDYVPFDLRKGTREIEFFKRPVSSALRGYGDTNMQMSMCESSGLIIGGLRLMVRGSALNWITVQQLRDLMLYAALEFRMADKLYWQGHPEQAMWGSGIYFDPELLIRPYVSFLATLRWTEHRFPKIHTRDVRSADFEIGAEMMGWKARRVI